MSVIKKANSKNWYIKFTENGVPYERSSGTRIKAEAEAIERQLRTKLRDERHNPTASEITLKDTITAYLEDHTPPVLSAIYHQQMSGVCDRIQGTLSPSNATRYLHDPSNPNQPTAVTVQPLQITNMSEINAATLTAHYRQRVREGYKASTIHDEFQIIKRLMNYAAGDGKNSPHSKMTGFPTIKIGPGRQRVLTDGEIRDIRAAITTTLHVDLFDMLNYTGARYMDICKMTWANIDEAEDIITLKHYKTKRAIEIHMFPEVAAILKRRKAAPNAHSKWVFQNQKNDNHLHHCLYWWRSACSKTDVNSDEKLDTALNPQNHAEPAVPHHLRHTFANRLHRAGFTQEEIQTMMGHNDPKSSRRYSKPYDRNIVIGKKAESVFTDLF